MLLRSWWINVFMSCDVHEWKYSAVRQRCHRRLRGDDVIDDDWRSCLQSTSQDIVVLCFYVQDVQLLFVLTFKDLYSNALHVAALTTHKSFCLKLKDSRWAEGKKGEGEKKKQQEEHAGCRFVILETSSITRSFFDVPFMSRWRQTEGWTILLLHTQWHSLLMNIDTKQQITPMKSSHVMFPLSSLL